MDEDHRKYRHRAEIVYIVIATTNRHINNDEAYIINSVWKSRKKAEKRKAELNGNGEEWLLDNYGCCCFEIETKFISK